MPGRKGIKTNARTIAAETYEYFRFDLEVIPSQTISENAKCRGYSIHRMYVACYRKCIHFDFSRGSKYRKSLPIYTYANSNPRPQEGPALNTDPHTSRMLHASYDLPPILALSINTQSERCAEYRAAAGRTAITIAHRLSTTKDAKCISVMGRRVRDTLESAPAPERPQRKLRAGATCSDNVHAAVQDW